jgi:hypothetical protein
MLSFSSQSVSHESVALYGPSEEMWIGVELIEFPKPWRRKLSELGRSVSDFLLCCTHTGRHQPSVPRVRDEIFFPQPLRTARSDVEFLAYASVVSLTARSDQFIPYFRFLVRVFESVTQHLSFSLSLSLLEIRSSFS